MSVDWGGKNGPNNQRDLHAAPSVSKSQSPIVQQSVRTQKPFQEPETLPASTPAYYPVSYWLAYYKKTLVKFGGEKPLSIRAGSKCRNNKATTTTTTLSPLSQTFRAKIDSPTARAFGNSFLLFVVSYILPFSRSASHQPVI